MAQARTAEPGRPAAGRGPRPDPLAIALAWLRPLRNVQLLAAVLIATALVLGYIGLWQYLSGKGPAAIWGRTWDGVLFYDLQLPVLSAAPLQVAGDFPVVLSVARFLAPIGASVAAFAALQLVLQEQWQGFIAARSRGHAIVAGDGLVALTLARHLDRKAASDGKDAEPGDSAPRAVTGSTRGVLVSAHEGTLAQAKQYGILTVRGDPAGPGS